MNDMIRMMKSVLATIEAGGFAPDDFLPKISGGRNARRILVRNYLRKKLAPVLKKEKEEKERQKPGAVLIPPKSGAMLIRRVDEHAQTKPVPPAPQALDMVSQQRADPLGKLRASHATQTAEHACAKDAQAWHQENVRKTVGETPKEVTQVKEHQELTDSTCCRKSAQNRAKTCRNRAKPTRNFAKPRKTLQNVSKFAARKEVDLMPLSERAPPADGRYGAGGPGESAGADACL